MAFGPGFGGGFWNLGQGGAGSFSPVGAARLRDPRYAYANALLTHGTSTAPAQTNLEGASRAGQALVGAWLMRDANQEYQGRESSYAKAIADALKAGQGAPAVTEKTEDQSLYGGEGPITRTVTPAVPGDMNRMMQILSANPDAAPMALQLGLQNMNYQRERADKKEDVAGTQKFQMDMQTAQQQFAASQAELTRAQQAALQNSSQQNQADLQRAQQGFTAAQNDLNRALETQKIGAQQGNQAFERANKLRDEYSTLTKDFRVVQDAYSKIKSTSDSGAGDMSLLYSYVKLLDPGSVVRESEFGTAAASGSFGERVQGAVNRILTGERLPPTLREAFKSEAESLYKAQKSGADRLRSQYEDLASRYGIKKEDVIQDYTEKAPGPVKVTTAAEFTALPSGTTFIAPDGSQRVKP